MSLNVGFIGLGNIKAQKAKHLIRDGFVTRVFDVQTSSSALAAQGAWLVRLSLKWQPVLTTSVLKVR